MTGESNRLYFDSLCFPTAINFSVATTIPYMILSLSLVVYDGGEGL